MSRGPQLDPLILTDDERRKLTDLGQPAQDRPRLALRARIVLACADGHDNPAVAAAICASPPRPSANGGVASSTDRLDGLTDEPRPGAPRTITDADVEQVVTRTLETKPKAATHWSTRGMAEPPACRQTAIVRIWRAFGLQAAPARDVQALDRPVLRREGPRRRRPVHEPAGAGDRAVRRREEPGAGPGPHPAPAADGARPGRAAHPRLRPPRHDLAVRGAERRHRRR